MDQQQLIDNLVGQMAKESRYRVGEAKDRRSHLREHQHHNESYLIHPSDCDPGWLLSRRSKVLRAEIEYLVAHLKGHRHLKTEAGTIQQGRNAILYALEPYVLELKYIQQSTPNALQNLQGYLARQREKNESGIPSLACMECVAAHWDLELLPGTSDLITERFAMNHIADHYGVNATDQRGVFDQRFCHLTGWWAPESVKVTRIVPMFMSANILRHLFRGDQATSVQGYQNALMLHPAVEASLYKGDIAIVPYPSPTNLPTEWKCVVLDQNLLSENLYEQSVSLDESMPSLGLAIKYKDVDNKLLEFKNTQRPATKYMFFRFIMSLLINKMRGRIGIVNSLASEWCLTGTYLNSTPISKIANYMCALQLPRYLFGNQRYPLPAREALEDLETLEAMLQVWENLMRESRSGQCAEEESV